MEVITEFTPLFYSIFTGLIIICAGIVSAIIFKRIQKYKWHQYCKNHNLNMDVDKIENAFNGIFRNLDELDNFMKESLLYATNPLLRDQMQLEIDSIRGKIQHQLGHIPRMRSYLK